MPALVALVAGLVFGAGLTVSQMVDPAKVLGFLDFGGIARGTWDPSLALVMGAALAVSAPAYYLAQKRGRAALGALRIPTRRDLDTRLIAGAVVFGAGWGLVGFCPGPAIAALGFGAAKALVFFAAMLAGMALYELTAAPRGPRSAPVDQTA
jgi:uncharacterized membrane protein YedE/YeeE